MFAVSIRTENRMWAGFLIACNNNVHTKRDENVNENYGEFPANGDMGCACKTFVARGTAR